VRGERRGNGGKEAATIPPLHDVSTTYHPSVSRHLPPVGWHNMTAHPCEEEGGEGKGEGVK
jgi:hypothetical protein